MLVVTALCSPLYHRAKHQDGATRCLAQGSDLVSQHVEGVLWRPGPATWAPSRESKAEGSSAQTLQLENFRCRMWE